MPRRGLNPAKKKIHTKTPYTGIRRMLTDAERMKRSGIVNAGNAVPTAIASGVTRLRLTPRGRERLVELRGKFTPRRFERAETRRMLKLGTHSWGKVPLKPEVRDSLARLVDEDPKIRNYALIDLNALLISGAMPSPPHRMHSVGKALYNVSDMELDRQQARSAVIRTALGDESAENRAFAVELAGWTLSKEERNNPEIWRELADVEIHALGDESYSVRRTAIRNVTDKRAVPKLIEIMVGDKYPQLRDEAADCLASMKAKEAIEPMRRCIEQGKFDNPKAMRATLNRLLFNTGEMAHEDYLATVPKHDPRIK